MNDIHTYANTDQAVLAIAVACLSSMRAEIEKRGLRASDPKIEVWNRTPSKYTSELQYTVFDGEQLFDQIECLIYHDGRQMATPDEIRRWLDDMMNSILREKDTHDA